MNQPVDPPLMNMPSAEQVVARELLYTAYDRKPLNLVSTAVVVATLGTVFWSRFPSTLVAIWLAAVLSSAVIGYVEWAAFKRTQPDVDQVKRWETIFMLQAAYAGASWSLGPAIMLTSVTGTMLALLLGILFTVCSVAMISVAAQRHGMVAFVVAAMTPAAIALLLRNDTVEQLLGLTLLAGMTIQVMVGREFHNGMRNLLASQYRMDAVLDNALDAVVTCNADGFITGWNRRAEAIFGWSRADALGLPFFESMVPERYRQIQRDALDEFLSTGNLKGINRRVEVLALDRQGRELPVELSITPVRVGQQWSFTAFIADISDRVKAANSLRASEERYRTLLENTTEGVVVHRGGLLLYGNKAANRLLGGGASPSIVGLKVLDLVHPESRQIVVERMRRIIEAGGVMPMVEEKFINLDGNLIEAEVQSMHIEFDGAPATLVVFRDITAHNATLARLANTNKQLGALIEALPDIIILKDGLGRWLVTNEAAKRLFRLHQLPWEGKTDGELIELHPMFREAHEICMADDEVAWGAGVLTLFTETLVNEHDLPVTLEVRKMPIFNDQGQRQALLIIGRDVTLQKQAEEEIKQLAFYDSLTGLPNRRLLQDRLKHALASSARTGLKGALLFIDLDHFKTINDTQGHHQGDALLAQAARRLSDFVRECDTVARLGGDEFVVMLEDLSANDIEAAAYAKSVGEKILNALNEHYLLGDGQHHVTSSIGVTLFGTIEGESEDEPMKRADLAMYQAKTAGRNTVRFFEPLMQSEVSARAALDADLRDAVGQGQFTLFYQPQIESWGEIVGVEALLRWRHPQRGMVSPLAFIPVAEETGLILNIGQWVLQTACEQLARWAKQPRFEHLSIAVNVSARQFHDDTFVDRVLIALEQTGANPRRLKLELTESLLVNDIEGVIAKMNHLKDRGVGFSLDDFGTGYSSLSYLKRLPLDQLKIDQSFIRDILVDPNDAAIAKMVVALGNSLGLSVIAEGVEMEEQREFLAQNGCLTYQGYLFSRPLPLAEFETFAGNKV